MGDIITDFPTHYYIYTCTRLIDFALAKFIARIVLGMSVLHGTPCPMKVVFVFVSPRHVACCHRVMYIQSDVVIKQYPDQLILTNAGGFPVGVDVDNILTVNSMPRCKLITEVLQKAGFIEKSGQGVDKMFYHCLMDGYKLSERYYEIAKNVGTVEGNRKDDTVNVPVNLPNLATILGVSEKTIKRDLAAMQSAGFIKRVGSDKTGHWEISN